MHIAPPLRRAAGAAAAAHAKAVVLGLIDVDLHTCADLIHSYADLGDTAAALRLLRHRRSRFAFLYNTALRDFSQTSSCYHAFSFYNSMLADGVRPDDRTYPFLLTVCADFRSFEKGLEAHSSICKLGFTSDVFVGNTLLSFYGACGDVSSAVQMFDEMPDRDIVSYNSIISMFSTNGFYSDSLGSFIELTKSNLAVNSVSLISTLPATGTLGDEAFGEGVHGYAIKLGLDCNIVVSNAFIDMYGKLVDLQGAMRLFRCMHKKSDVSWNSIISAFVHNSHFRDAMDMFKDMISEGGEKPNSVTISSLLPALVELGLFSKGREIHGYILRTKMDSDVFIANSLLDMYAKSGNLIKASEKFHRMECKNVVSWNAMIANCTQNGAELEALRLVREMQMDGECPNSVTFANVLPACSRTASLTKGKEIHARSIRDESFFDIFVSNALIDMYAKCGRLHLGRNVFDVSKKDQVSYNSLIVGYSESNWCSEALILFKEMRFVGHDYDVVSFMGALSACTNLAAFKQGKEIHAVCVRKMLHTHLFMANSLLELYIKSGNLCIAKKIFERISNKDVASWNTMTLGYGAQCDLDTAINLFDMMKDENVEYDHVSYVAVLSACSHGGLLERGKKYFKQMLNQNIRPMQMHYACMVDLLGRAGLMDEAVKCIEEMPFEADSNVWGALLGACRVHGNIELAKWAAEHLFELKPEHSGYYILLSNMYAEVGRWEEAKEIRELMKLRKVKKNTGYSWVEVGNKMHAFVVGERIEEQELEISSNG